MARGPLVYVQATVYRWLKASGAVSLRLLKLRSACREITFPDMKKSRFEEMTEGGGPEPMAPKKEHLTTVQIVLYSSAALLSIAAMAWWDYGEHGSSDRKDTQTGIAAKEEADISTGGNTASFEGTQLFNLTLDAFREAVIDAHAKTGGSGVSLNGPMNWDWTISASTNSGRQELAGHPRRALEFWVEPQSSKLSQVTCRVVPLKSGSAEAKLKQLVSLPLLICQALDPSTSPQEHTRHFEGLLEKASRDVTPSAKSAGIVADGTISTKKAEITLSATQDYFNFTFHPPDN